MKKKLAFVIATWFGLGFSPIAPGTVGTLAALPLYFAIRGFGPFAILAAAFVLSLAGIWASGIVAEVAADEDPQIVVVDEVAGVLLTLAFAPHSWGGVVLAVLLFRVFDMTKPFPARAAESLPGGWGIVVDDLVAGVWAAVVTNVLL